MRAGTVPPVRRMAAPVGQCGPERAPARTGWEDRTVPRRLLVPTNCTVPTNGTVCTNCTVDAEDRT